VFLRKVVPGRSDRSYGIQVARLAGMPAAVIGRARAILTALEQDALAKGGRPAVAKSGQDPRAQLGLFDAATPGDEIVRRLKDVDLDRLTPIEALALLADLQRDIGK